MRALLVVAREDAGLGDLHERGVVLHHVLLLGLLARGAAVFKVLKVASDVGRHEIVHFSAVSPVW